MYKHFTKEDWIKMLSLPSDYSVDSVLVCGTYDKEKQLKRLLSVLKDIKIEYSIENIEDKFFSRITPIKLGNKRLWFDISYGSAYLSEMLHLGCLFGSKSNILIGSCGGLAKGLKPLDLILPTYSYGNESTTRIYSANNNDNKHYPDSFLTNKIKDSYKGSKTIYTGPIITCQAMLGETKEDVDNWSKQGYIGVEMESSSFFAISNHFNVPSTAFFHIADNLIEGDYVGSENYNLLKQAKEDLEIEKYKTVIKVLM